MNIGSAQMRMEETCWQGLFMAAECLCALVSWAVFGALTIGGLLGAAAGYFGGIVENLIMRVMDVFLAIPSMMLAITVVAAMGASLTNLIGCFSHCQNSRNLPEL